MKLLNKGIFNNYRKAYSKLANLGIVERIKYEEVAQFLGRLKTVRGRIEQVQKIQYPHFFFVVE